MTEAKNCQNPESCGAPCPVKDGTHQPAEALQQIAEPALQSLRERLQITRANLGHGNHWVEVRATVVEEAIALHDRQAARIAEQETQHREELRAYEITVANREARIADLEAQLEAIGAAGVEPLRKPAAAPQAVQAAAPTDDELTMAWIAAGGVFFGPNTPTGSIPEAKLFPFLRRLSAPAHPSEGVSAQIETLRSELAEEKEAADNWRRIALQFDNHRLQALWHLKRILHADSSVDEYKAAEQFLAAPPLDGEAVLAQRIAALAATQPAAQDLQLDTLKLARDRLADMLEDDDGQAWKEARKAMPIIDAALAAQAKQGG